MTLMETFKTIPPVEFLAVHTQLQPPVEMPSRDASKYAQIARVPYGFGVSLQIRTADWGWDEPFANAIHSGSDRLFLSTLKWLTEPGNRTHAKAETIRWLSGPMNGFVEKCTLAKSVLDEVSRVNEGHENPSAVAEEVEAEIQEYPAFVALTNSMEVDLFANGLTMKEAGMERFGATLAAVAIKRQLEGNSARQKEQLAAMEIAALNAIWELK